MTPDVPGPTAYDERLAVPWWGWPAGLAVALLLAAQLHSGAGGARAVVPYLLVPAAVLLALGAASRGRVVVSGGLLHVPGARVPLDVVAGAVPLDREGTRRVRGPAADPRAYVATRPWLSGSVQVRLADPQDDTPYWVVGTRRPEALAAVLRAAAGLPEGADR